jgi:uncharacterized protein involved in exopolysaccharide biosynthesis
MTDDERLIDELRARIEQLEALNEAGHQSRLEMGIYDQQIVARMNEAVAGHTAALKRVDLLQKQVAQQAQRIAELEGNLEVMRRRLADD